MRPSFTISLLVLSLLLSEPAQGIRLGKFYNFMSSLGQHKSIIHHEKEIALSKTLKNDDHVVAGEALLCKDGHCSGNGRKLFSVTLPSTTTTISKNDEEISEKNDIIKAHDPISNGEIKSTKRQHGEKEEKSASVNSLSTSDHENLEYQPYPDAVDLAEMDYSPARRKTPIHN